MKRTLLERIYLLTHRNRKADGNEDIPYYWKYSIFQVVAKPIRKFFSVVIIPTIPFNGLRVWAYRLCGYKIGKNVFIGMRCYLDDLCYDKLIVEDDVTISYGVYFASHGRKQNHNTIILKKNSYIGMRATIIAKTDIIVGCNSIVGACTLVNKSIPDGATSVGIPNRIIQN